MPGQNLWSLGNGTAVKCGVDQAVHATTYLAIPNELAFSTPRILERRTDCRWVIASRANLSTRNFSVKCSKHTTRRSAVDRDGPSAAPCQVLSNTVQEIDFEKTCSVGE